MNQQVKPGYTAESAFLKSMNKYFKGYDVNKAQSSYDTSWGWRIPGGEFKTKEIKLFSYGNKTVKMSVEWLGLGKVGYFFQMKCDEKAYSEVYAKDVMSALLPAFQKAENINSGTELLASAAALFAALLSPVPGDEAAVTAEISALMAQLGLA